MSSAVKLWIYWTLSGIRILVRKVIENSWQSPASQRGVGCGKANFCTCTPAHTRLEAGTRARNEIWNLLLNWQINRKQISFPQTNIRTWRTKKFGKKTEKYCTDFVCFSLFFLPDSYSCYVTLWHTRPAARCSCQCSWYLLARRCRFPLFRDKHKNLLADDNLVPAPLPLYCYASVSKLNVIIIFLHRSVAHANQSNAFHCNYYYEYVWRWALLHKKHFHFFSTLSFVEKHDASL